MPIKKDIFRELLLKLNSLTIFRNIKEDLIIRKLTELCSYSVYKNIDFKEEILIDKYSSFISALLENAEEYRLSGNIFSEHIINLFLSDENIFSAACERNEQLYNKTIYKYALKDMEVLKYLLNLDEILEYDILNYTPIETCRDDYNKINSNQNPEDILKLLMYHYCNMGCGQIGVFKMLKYSDQKFVGIKNADNISFENIVGYEYQKETLINNTKAFVNGFPSNNVLLVGARGTGKSSCVKALSGLFFKDGLRILEISKEQLLILPDILNLLSTRGKKFIIFLDDLSYENNETSYKHMKSLLEGGTELKPENVLFYATSNRRHLISEKWSDKKTNYEDEEIHNTDAINEKLSLSDRFGITIVFSKPTPEEYINIVLKLAQNANLNIPKDIIIKKAREWELTQKGLSGRTAKQFIDHLIWEENKN